MKKKSYADLFKPQNNMAPIVEEQESILSISENGSGSSFGASWSSGLSTPFGSELGSSGSEDEEFLAELSRQMAECMLNDEEVHAEDTDGSSLCEGFEVCQLKNQPQESGLGEGRVKGNKRVQKTDLNYVNYIRNGKVIGGSGMKAIFLDNSGSSYGSGGTGVFLPRLPNDPTPKKKKPVCSTVLMPMRVLQALELHYSRLSDSSSPVSRGTSPRCTGHDTPWTLSSLEEKRYGLLSQQNDDPRFQNHPAHEEEDEEEMQLPQEWTY